MLGLCLFLLSSILTGFSQAAERDYAPALAAAQRAALIQSGISAKAHMVETWAGAEARRVSYSLLGEAPVKATVFVGAVAYKRQLIANGIWSPMPWGATTDLAASPQSCLLITKWRF